MLLLQPLLLSRSRLITQLLRLRHAGSNKTAKSHYEVLGVEHDAPAEVIKRAFIAMSKKLHPDHNPSRPDLHKRFVVAAEAYRVLSRPELRRQYDSTLLGKGGGVHGTDFGAPSGFGNRAGARASSTTDEPFYWRDESLHAMRDKSKDRFYAADRFYGVPGVARQSNHVVALVLLAVGLLGSMAIFFMSAQTSRWQRNRQEEEQRLNGQLYQEVRRRAALKENDIHRLLDQHRASTTTPKRSLDEAEDR